MTRVLDQVCLACITLVWVVSSAALADGLNVADTAEEAQPLQPGAPAPSFTVYEVDGSPFVLDPESLERPVMLITFRGGWCPYCNFHLSELRHVLPEIRESGVDVLFLSGDRPDRLYDGLREQTAQDIAGLDYRILSDYQAQAASALGIAFKAPAATIEGQRRRGRDIRDSSMLLHDALPVPAIFVIDADGIIRFTYANPDYEVRLPAEEVKAAAESVLSGR